MTRPDRPAGGSHVWVLNFDAEDELARGPGHNPNASTRTRMAALGPLVATLVGDDRVLGTAGDAAGHLGHAWCPTPSARRRLAAAGAVVPAAPSFEVLREANHRRFCAALGPTLPGAAFFDDEAALLAHLIGGSPSGPSRGWILKRPFAYAGRGRLRVSSTAEELATPTSAARAWIRSSLEKGGVDVTPWVDRVGDYALHGFLDGGDLHLGAPTQQTCDADGRWLGSSQVHDLSAPERRALVEDTERVAEALARIGYFGPFGVDAFRFHLGDFHFCPRIEVNARYTMGWSAGFAGA